MAVKGLMMPEDFIRMLGLTPPPGTYEIRALVTPGKPVEFSYESHAVLEIPEPDDGL